MKKRIFLPIVLCMLITEVASAKKPNPLRTFVKSSYSFANDTVQDSWKNLSLRNLALLCAAYYIGLPIINRAREIGWNILDRTSTYNGGIGSLVSFIAKLFAIPHDIRLKIDPKADTRSFVYHNHDERYAKKIHVHELYSNCAHKHPEFALTDHSHDDYVHIDDPKLTQFISREEFNTLNTHVKQLENSIKSCTHVNSNDKNEKEKEQEIKLRNTL